MATPYSPDVDSVITEAFERIGVSPETITDYQLESATRSLNAMLAEWSAKKTLAWRIERWENEGVIPAANNTEGDAEIGQDLTLTLPSNTIDVVSIAIRYPSSSDIWLRRMSYEDFTSLPNKSLLGFPNQYLLLREKQPKLILWRPAEEGYSIYAWLRVAVDTVEGIAETDIVPYRFVEALFAGLAAKLAVKYAPERLDALMMLAEKAFMEAARADDDGVGLTFMPGRFM